MKVMKASRKNPQLLSLPSKNPRINYTTLIRCFLVEFLLVSFSISPASVDAMDRFSRDAEPDNQVYLPLTMVKLAWNPAIPEPVEVSSGGYHTCALTETGLVRCWGANWYGQLGDNTTELRTSPVNVSGLVGQITAITTGWAHSCALNNEGDVFCWGLNDDGQLGDGTNDDHSTAVQVTGLPVEIIAIGAGGYHTCGLTNTHTVLCWGKNSNGQLGDDSTESSSQPVSVVNLGVAYKIAAGANHTCAIVSAPLSGSVKCWGANDWYQVGDGTTTDRHQPTQVQELIENVQSITAGLHHSCAITNSGGVKCWGHNGEGQLGNGSNYSGLGPPSDVIGLSANVVKIDSGGRHTCASLQDGSMKCWGHNSNGELGDKTAANRFEPVDVGGMSEGVESVSSGDSHSCAIAQDELYCWGNNDYGQLGLGYLVRGDTLPVDTIGSNGSLKISTGANHSCLISNTNEARCWGSNSHGQVGDGTDEIRSSPEYVSGLGSNVGDIAAGFYHSCAVAGGEGKCWGFAQLGQLGDGGYYPKNLLPVDVTNLTTSVAITAGWGHSCAIESYQNNAKCWGYNQRGQLGDGTNTTSGPPVNVTGLGLGVSKISAGYQHTCALDASAVKCWGWNNYGQVGDGTTTDRNQPVQVMDLSSGVVDLAVGGFHSCAVMDIGSVFCWGSNSSGQLGDGTRVNSNVPHQVTGITNAVRVTAGMDHSCALLSDNSVKCWGDNWHGQLGAGDFQSSTTPRSVQGLHDGATMISAGGWHTCALSGGIVRCWGNNSHGQLGDGSYDGIFSPEKVIWQ